jgi:hypothetical protein
VPSPYRKPSAKAKAKAIGNRAQKRAQKRAQSQAHFIAITSASLPVVPTRRSGPVSGTSPSPGACPGPSKGDETIIQRPKYCAAQRFASFLGRFSACIFSSDVQANGGMIVSSSQKSCQNDHKWSRPFGPSFVTENPKFQALAPKVDETIKPVYPQLFSVIHRLIHKKRCFLPIF